MKEKKIVLNNGTEADLLSLILKERSIDFVIISYHDSAMNGLWQTQKGWGFAGVDAKDEDKVREILAEIQKDID